MAILFLNALLVATSSQAENFVRVGPYGVAGKASHDTPHLCVADPPPPFVVRNLVSRRMKMKAKGLLKLATALMVLPVFQAALGQDRSVSTPTSGGYGDWKIYGGGLDNIHYSSLRQINGDNVGKLAVAWAYDSGDAFPDS